MDKKALYFAEKIRSKVKDNIKSIILFGSRARNDFYEGSDYDFIIITDKDVSGIKKIITDCEVEFLNKYDIPAGSIFYTQEEWENVKNLPLGHNVLKEGIEL